MLYLTTCVGLGYGRRIHSLEAFLGSRGSPTSPRWARRPVSDFMHGGFAYRASYTVTPGRPSPGMGYLPASPHRLPTTNHPPRQPPPQAPKSWRRRVRRLGWARHWRGPTGTGLSTRCPSTTPVGLALGPDSPRAEQPGPGTLGHPAGKILTSLALLMPAFSLAPPPPHPHRAASPVARRSPTHPHP